MAMLDHRAKAYYQPGSGCDTILYSGHTTEYHANELLSGFLSLPFVTGGHIERHEQGIGWVLATDDEAETERRRIDDDTLYPRNL